MPHDCHKVFLPKSLPYFKMKEEVIRDEIFQKRLEKMMNAWKLARMNGDKMTTWECIIKPGIMKLAKERQCELKEEKKGRLGV